MRVNPKTRQIGLAIALLLLGGCDSKGVQGAQDKKDATSYGGEQKVPGSELSLQDFMIHVIQHNAKETWKWQAIAMDKDGTHDSYPKTDEEWEKAESAALTLVELTRPLDAIGGGAQNPEWLKHVAALRAASLDTAKAAETKQIEDFIAGGDRINESCLSCHYKFAPHLELPQTKQ
jgi:hypothetical protein